MRRGDGVQCCAVIADQPRIAGEHEVRADNHRSFPNHCGSDMERATGLETTVGSLCLCGVDKLQSRFHLDVI
jgi:hypothetical protein